MNFKGHAAGAGLAAGLTAVGWWLAGLSEADALLTGGAVFLGGLFPDLDVGSIPGRWFGRIGFLAAAVLFALGTFGQATGLLVWSSLLGLISLFLHGMKHRGPTHKYWLPLFLIILAVVGSFQGAVSPLLISFAAGICVHLTLDFIFPWNLKGWLF